MNYKEIISKMTLEEKASFLSGKDFWQTTDMEKFGIKSMFLADGPNGVRRQEAAADHLGLNQSLKATCYPTCATVANSWNIKLAEEMAEYLGKEAAYQKVNVLLGPGLNIKRNPLCGRNFEYFSEDPYLSGKLSAAYVRGIQSNGIASCIKHFAVNNQEARRLTIDSIIDERTMREIYLTAFEIAVKEGKAKTIMSSYNRINGVYANENEFLLGDILRKEWGFNGVIVTDWGGNNDRVKALVAGNELEMPTTGGETNREVIKAVNDGVIEESVIDTALERLLKLIFETNTATSAKISFDEQKHHEMAERMAEDSIVLLKNTGNVLPLKKETKVAIIGDFARYSRFQGAGSSVVNPLKIENALENIKEAGINSIGFEKGFKRFGKKCRHHINKAVKLAKKADVVLLYIGLDEATETEGLDRKNMKLPLNQIELITALKKTNKKIIAVLSCGCALETDWDVDVDALLHCSLGGQAGARAAVNVLTGKTNPSGKLAESYPMSYTDCPSASNFPGAKSTVEYREGIYVGYRYYETAKIPVKYPFGFGLSYTDFKYSDLKVSENGVSFKLNNCGKTDGAEIAQLYIGSVNGKIFRPTKELKGFAKIFLKAGESKQIDIAFDEYTFRYFNINTHKWEVESCDYKIMVGASSADIKLDATFTVKGTSAKNPYEGKKLPSYYSGKADDVAADEFIRLYGSILPQSGLKFVRKNRIIADYNTCVYDLVYAKGWTGRLFARALRFANKFLWAIGMRNAANVMMIGMFYMPLRGISRMIGGAISHGQLDGIITMFNGKFFKGFNIFIKAGRARKKRIKAEKLKKKQEACK